ncbi:MAG: putative bifunctional diguanylate cyclase/phosphodiesterase [Porcipelethomonas sp.]
MRAFDGNEPQFDYRHIVNEMFDCFDEVIYIDEGNNRISEIRSGSKFGIFHDPDKGAVTLEKMINSIYPDDIRLLEEFNTFTGKKLVSEIRCRNSEGKYRWCYVQLIPVDKSSYLAMYLDLSESSNEGVKIKSEYLDKKITADMENQLLSQKYNAILNHADVMMIEYNISSDSLTITSNLTNKFIFAAKYESTLGEFLDSGLIHENDKEVIYSVLRKLESVKYAQAVINLKNNDGRYFRCQGNFYGIYDAGGSLSSVISYINNIEENKTVFDNSRKSPAAEPEYGLAGPKAFCAKMRELLESKGEKNYAVILFDIERFKSVNELYGIAFGDDVIRFIGYSLKNFFEDENVLTVRFASDNFGIFMEYADDEQITNIIGKLNSKISYYRHVSLKIAYGVYKINDPAIPPRLICDYANMAKNSIKGNHLSHVAFYTEKMKKRIIEDISIENEMEDALASGQFVMYLQPKCNIKDRGVVGAEALVRWNHPQKGMIMPGKFIPIFEKNGFIIHLDRYIWETACRTIRKWLDMGAEPVPISVNVSRVNVGNPELIQILDGLIGKYGIDKKFLELEITETVYYDDQQSLLDVLARLKKSGYTLLMDDFGSGFSSLSMLKNTPFDVLKIDRAFLNETMITDKGKKIIRHAICLSNDIGLNIVAEGVETKEQADYLLQCGCSVAQGYYYSKPVSVENFENILGIDETSRV